MPGTSDKLITLLEKLNEGRSESDKLDLSSYNRGKIKDLGYSAEIPDAMKLIRELFSWRIKDYEYADIEKRLAW